MISNLALFFIVVHNCIVRNLKKQKDDLQQVRLMIVISEHTVNENLILYDYIKDISIRKLG